MKINEKFSVTDLSYLYQKFTDDLQLIFSDVSNSSFYINFLLIADGVLLNPIFDDMTVNVIFNALYDKYKIKWMHLATLFLLDYNPIENYRMTENMLDFQQEGKTESGTENYHEKTTEKSAVGASVKQGKQVTAVNVSETESTITTADGVQIKSKNYNTTMDDTETELLANAQTSDGTTATESMQGSFRDFAVSGKKTQEKMQIKHNNAGINVTDDITDQEFDVTGISGHKGNRSGNIGVTTTQQMAESEIEYSKKMLVIDFICRDITDFLSAGVY